MIALMISLSIVGGILLIFAIVLICPVVVDLQFQEDFIVKVKVLGIPFWFFPQKEKARPEHLDKEKKKMVAEEKTGKFSKIKGILERKGISGLLDFLKELTVIAVDTGEVLFSHLVVYRLSVDMTISNGDAAETAIQYGQACAVVYPAINAVTAVVKCKQSYVCVIPDFEEKKSKAYFRVKAGIRPIFVITAGIVGLFQFIKVYRKHT